MHAFVGINCIYVLVCVCVCVSACLCVCVCQCVCMCMYVHLFLHVWMISHITNLTHKANSRNPTSESRRRADPKDKKQATSAIREPQQLMSNCPFYQYVKSHTRLRPAGPPLNDESHGGTAGLRTPLWFNSGVCGFSLNTWSAGTILFSSLFFLFVSFLIEFGVLLFYFCGRKILKG